MSGQTETIEIKHCPHCGDTHVYMLAVERSTVIRMLTMNDIYEQPERVRFTRLFTCHAQKKNFEAVIVLTQDSSTKITSVEVIGPAEEDNEQG